MFETRVAGSRGLKILSTSRPDRGGGGVCCAPLLICEMFIKDESRKQDGQSEPKGGGG